MATVSYRLEDLKKAIVGIGYVGENDHMHVLIDCKEVFDEYPDAVPTMAIVPPVGEGYPKAVTRDGDVVEWLVKDSDVTVEGDGEFQLTFTEGEIIRKSVNARFRVKRSISGSGSAPSGVQDWLTDANEKLAEVEEATRDAEAAANHQPYIGIDGYWYTWNGEEFVKNVKAQGEKGDPGDPGSPGDPTQLIDDTAGEGQTEKTWSADKLDEEFGSVLSEIQPLTPAATVSDVGKTLKVKTVSDNKVSGYEFGDIPEVPTAATSEQIKAGTDTSHPLVTVRQHEAVFFALAKLAGADMASLSPVTVGQFPDTQKTAIQKMLGIYESPWELIRNDTFTNATESNLEITVDDNGEPFELTDIVLEIKLPVQETQASIGNYGIISIYDKNNNEERAFCGAVSQSPSDTAYKIAFVEITQSKGLFIKKYTRFSGSGNQQQLTIYANNTGNKEMPYRFSSAIFSRILIKNVTGTVNIQLYGKRKWN